MAKDTDKDIIKALVACQDAIKPLKAGSRLRVLKGLREWVNQDEVMKMFNSMVEE